MRSPGTSARDSATSKLPAASVPPVPSRTSSPPPFSAIPLAPALQISSCGFGMFGAPWPKATVEPGNTPDVMTGADGDGVGVGACVCVTVTVCVGVCVLAAVGVLAGVPVPVASGVLVRVFVGDGVVVGVPVGAVVNVLAGVLVG